MSEKALWQRYDEVVSLYMVFLLWLAVLLIGLLAVSSAMGWSVAAGLSALGILLAAVLIVLSALVFMTLLEMDI